MTLKVKMYNVKTYKKNLYTEAKKSFNCDDQPVHGRSIGGKLKKLIRAPGEAMRFLRFNVYWKFLSQYLLIGLGLTAYQSGNIDEQNGDVSYRYHLTFAIST